MISYCMYLPLVIVLALSACHDGCIAYDARCVGSNVQVCNADEEWEHIVDCNAFDPGKWICVENDTEVYCDLDMSSE